MVEIVAYRSYWSAEFQAIAQRVRPALGPLALRIDHIGSTSIPGLAAKDVIDLMVTIASSAQFDEACMRVERCGFVRRADITSDNGPLPWTEPDPSKWEKRFCKAPADQRQTHVHIRVEGWPNQRYALLFRDFLRANPHTANIYAQAKHRIAAHVHGDREAYIDLKQPVCDLIALCAERWASSTGWRPPPSDA
jgi:GrpB-like predicted nucleotidyltransferase (UPF0157 family)